MEVMAWHSDAAGAGLVWSERSARTPTKSRSCSRGCLAFSFHNMVASAKTPPACSGEPGLGHPTCTRLSLHPQASPDKARSSLRPALSMMRAATAVNSTWKMPTTTEARLLS